MTRLDKYITFASSKTDCGIVFYDRKTGKQLRKEAFTEGERIGNLYSKELDEEELSEASYLFYEEDGLVPDPCAKAFADKFSFGKKRGVKDLKAVFAAKNYDWQGDKCPRISAEESLCYCMHVRGFTEHSSSGVTHRGTFAGIMEKIPYLKEIGVTTLELQPAYEFVEFAEKEKIAPKKEYEIELEKKEVLNYWGYQKAFYYAPKAAYSADEDAVKEFKDLVKALHKEGMELVMQFYFPKEVKRLEIPEILHYWITEYHVDGFHLMGENIPADMLAADDMLADTKLWYYSFNTDELYQRDEVPAYRRLSVYSDDYLYTMRKFLKGDEGMLESVLHQMRCIPAKTGRIHYMSNYFGFTLMDLVSYDRKHNEANGEENKDGNDYNCSWNCGDEGTTRKAKIRALRMKQIKNAMCMLLFTQSTPLIFMGDEFGNTQGGNNNPYCQDNTVTWLDWNCAQKNAELLNFWKQLMVLRKEHTILRPGREFRLMDTIACGYPDLSYHGESAWLQQAEYYDRHAGIMFCGKYAKKENGAEDDFLYLAMNMHWEKHELALPRLPKGMVWKPLLSTSEAKAAEETKADDGKTPTLEAEQSGVSTGELEPRSITVYICVSAAKHEVEKPVRSEKSAKTKKTATPDRKGGKSKDGVLAKKYKGIKQQ